MKAEMDTATELVIATKDCIKDGFLMDDMIAMVIEDAWNNHPADRHPALAVLDALRDVDLITDPTAKGLK